MEGTIEPKVDYIARLATTLNRDWAAIKAARESANQVLDLLSETLSDKFGGVSSDDLDLVAFGSLARREWTSGSDIDWTLLVDGQASPDHRQVARDLDAKISAISFRGKELPKPGAEGIFGNLVFSHDIIHHIGGQADTNRNTTRRILLLLEATPVRQGDGGEMLGPYERVIRGILYRYLHDDTNFAASGKSESRIPRFLLNDIVRYWRTICVDFAYKEWEQAGEKWAVRNIKLRMSRKMLFVSGLLIVFSCYKNQGLIIEDNTPDKYLPMMLSHLTRLASSTPLNIMAWAFPQLDLNIKAGEILDHYDEFLKIIDDPEKRDHLGRVPPGKVYSDPVFLEVRDVSHRFQAALDAVFFKEQTLLQEFALRYGVF